MFVEVFDPDVFLVRTSFEESQQQGLFSRKARFHAAYRMSQRAEIVQRQDYGRRSTEIRFAAVNTSRDVDA